MLLELELQSASLRKSPDWSLEELEKVLKETKNNKARDAYGHVYELFKYGGKNLKLSLLKLFNKIKNSQEFPEMLKLANVTSLYKSKGRKDDILSIIL